MQAGTSIARVLPSLDTEKCIVSDVFDMIRPHMEFTFNNILSHINTVFVLHSKGQRGSDGSQSNKTERSR